jgi:hypothetical protein
MDFEESPSLEREQAILDAVRAGKSTIEWFEIVLSPELTIEVSNPVMIDGVRTATTSRTAQLIADYYEDSALWTERINDLAYEHATIKLPPFFQDADSHMGDWSRVIKHSAIISTVVGERKEPYACAGKHWVLAKALWAKPWLAALYGWQVQLGECKLDTKDGFYKYKGIKTYPSTVLDVRAIQPLSLAHNCGTSKVLGHVDYAMFVRLWRSKSGTCKEILADKNLSLLVSKDGPLLDSRHPGVPKDLSWKIQT